MEPPDLVAPSLVKSGWSGQNESPPTPPDPQGFGGVAACRYPGTPLRPRGPFPPEIPW
jgi:hypothetical protein